MIHGRAFYTSIFAVTTVTTRSTLFTMSRRLVFALAISCVLVTAPATSHAAPKTIATIPLPKRARPQKDGSHLSSQTFRKTLVFFQRYLKRSRIPYQQIPTYSARGILIARLLSTAPQSPWLAIHIYQKRGITRIYIVPRTPNAAHKKRDSPK